MSTESPSKFTNRLVHETSPYLLQHAHNPVDWYPWGEEAIAKARAEGKAIFLSIGYSACHWCHVMEHESFEDEGIAHLMNQNFVCIKVDREERPDLDDIYMQAVQLMTGHGGWPVSVFLTTDLKPFFGGTYFPPRDGPRGIGFATLLLRLAEIYKNEPQRITDGTRELMEALAERAETATTEGAELTLSMLTTATSELARRFDPAYGGFGGAPKFPPSMALALLLREHRRTGDSHFLKMVETTLQKMAQGGLHDHLGGGFHRYSTDHHWLVPHFEKMLYDNALLAPVYFDASIITHNAYYEGIGRGVLDYVLRDMSHEGGGYFSAEDADSEGEEGKFYVWDRDDVMRELGTEEGTLFCEFYDVTAPGNFEGQNILNIVTPLEEFAIRRKLDVADLNRRLAVGRAKLAAIRANRVRPGLDDKILTAWNGMMLTAMAHGAQVTGDARYRESAERTASFLWENLRSAGKLLRAWRGGKAKVGGFIDDYAFFATGLLDLYETTFNTTWLDHSLELADQMIALFYDENSGGFYTGDGSDPTVLIRRKDTYDGATPSGNSAATLLLLRLGSLLDRSDYREKAVKTFASMNAYLTRMPGAVHHLLCAASFALEPPKEIAVIGELENPRTQSLLETVWRSYLPNRVFAATPPDSVNGGVNARIPFLGGRTMAEGLPSAFVCENYSCQRPVTSPGALDKLLRS